MCAGCRTEADGLRGRAAERHRHMGGDKAARDSGPGRPSGDNVLFDYIPTCIEPKCIGFNSFHVLLEHHTAGGNRLGFPNSQS